MAAVGEVRVEESLKIKIGEAKNLPNSGSRDTYCRVTLDNEDIFRTHVVEKSTNPFYGEEFQCEIPRQFRNLSLYVHEKGNRQDKVIGKVQLRKEELADYHGRDHWFPLVAVHPNSEVQGKVYVEIRFDEYLHISPESTPTTKHKINVRVLECRDLNTINGECNPYATVTLYRGKSHSRDENRSTATKKKCTSPKFEESFVFDCERKGQNHDRNHYSPDHLPNFILSVSLWHDDSRGPREMVGNLFPSSFLGEVYVLLKDLQYTSCHKAWYLLQPRDLMQAEPQLDLGSLRLNLIYRSNHVLTSHQYDDLRTLLLRSADVKPVSSSMAYILGEITDNKEAAQPLMRVCHLHGHAVRLVSALAEAEIAKTSDANTIFRGNTLTSKCIDELMKLVGLDYLHSTLKPIIDEIFSEKRSCEIDPERLKDSDNLKANMSNLEYYVDRIFWAIARSGLSCPQTMSEVFFVLKEAAMKQFPDSKHVQYQVVSGFIFLRFFAPAILGPGLFQLKMEKPDPVIHRGLTLISKAIQSLGNLVSTKTAFGFKEHFMVPLFKKFTDEKHIEAIKSYLDLISSLSKIHSPTMDTTTVLKEGYINIVSDNKGKSGGKIIKKRYCCLTNRKFILSKEKGGSTVIVLAVDTLTGIESVAEHTFNIKYLLKVRQIDQDTYLQAANCVDEKEWKDIVTKICKFNANRVDFYHPSAYLNGQWQCCKSVEMSSEGCTANSHSLMPSHIKMDIDSDREMERIFWLLSTNMDKLQTYYDASRAEEVYEGDTTFVHVSPVSVEDPETCKQTLAELLQCVKSLEQEHKNYTQLVHSNTILGSLDMPYGELMSQRTLDSYL